MKIIEKLSKHLQNKAVTLKALGLDNSYAWPQEDVVDVIDELSKKGFAILGGDVLQILDNGTIKYTYDNWYIQKQSGFSWEEYVAQSRDYARNYILSYPKIKDLRSIFNLVIASESEFASLSE